MIDNSTKKYPEGLQGTFDIGIDLVAEALEHVSEGDPKDTILAKLKGALACFEKIRQEKIQVVVNIAGGNAQGAKSNVDSTLINVEIFDEDNLLAGDSFQEETRGEEAGEPRDQSEIDDLWDAQSAKYPFGVM